MKDVYLDDERNTPPGWHRCHHVWEVIALIKAGEVRKLSLDHDLGDGEKTGYHLCLWMIENNRWPTEKPTVHSANPVGAHYMRLMIDQWYGKSWKDDPRFKTSGAKQPRCPGAHGDWCKFSYGCTEPDACPIRLADPRFNDE